MDYLTQKQLLELAPGAASRTVEERKYLIDTQEWADSYLRGASGRDFRPVFAMQGASHEDAGHDPSIGRHLVVLAHDSGAAWSLLNSHDRLMRCWLGAGYWVDGELLLAAVHPLSRRSWKQDTFEIELPDIGAQLRAMEKSLRKGHSLELASRIAKEGYIRGRGRPSAQALHDAAPIWQSDTRHDYLHTAASLVAAARKGNLAPSTNAKTRRNVKGIRRPDAYQHLALAAWKAAVELAK